jgi:hypothetical protein
LIADLSPVPGSVVVAGSSFSFVYTDETPMGLSTSALSNPTVLVDGAAVPADVEPTSGQAANYADDNGGSEGTQCQDIVTFQLPTGLTAGPHTVSVTVYDSDNDWDTVSNWTVSVPEGSSGGGAT